MTVRAINRTDDGFTLIELAVVILIIGVLLAIAIPTFLGVRGRAQNRSSQVALRHSLVAAKTAFSDTDNYASVTAASLQSIEPGILFVSGGSATATADIHFTVAGVNYTAWSLSKSGTCFGIQEDSGTVGTRYGTLTTGACDGSGFTWDTKWS